MSNTQNARRPRCVGSLRLAGPFLVLPLLLVSAHARATVVITACAQTHTNLGGTCGAVGTFQPLASDGLLAVATSSSDYMNLSIIEVADAAVFGSDSSSVASGAVHGLGIQPMAHAVAEVNTHTVPPDDVYETPSFHALATANIDVTHRVRLMDGAPPEAAAITSIPVMVDWALEVSGPTPFVSSSASVVFTVPGIPQITHYADNTGVPGQESRSGTSSFSVAPNALIDISASAGVSISHSVPGAGGGQAVADPFLYVNPLWGFAPYFVVEELSLENPGQWVEVTRAWLNNTGVIPEPGTLLIFTAGLVALGLMGRRPANK